MQWSVVLCYHGAASGHTLLSRKPLTNAQCLTGSLDICCMSRCFHLEIVQLGATLWVKLDGHNNTKSRNPERLEYVESLIVSWYSQMS